MCEDPATPSEKTAAHSLLCRMPVFEVKFRDTLPLVEPRNLVQLVFDPGQRQL